MELRRIQEKWLAAMARQREQKFTLSGRLVMRCRRWLLLAILVAALGFCLWQLGLPSLSLVALGFGIGGILADCGWIVTGHRLWPVILEVTDWNKVSELLGSKKRV